MGNLEQPGKSSFNSKILVQFLESDVSVNWAFSSGKYGWTV